MSEHPAGGRAARIGAWMLAALCAATSAHGASPEPLTAADVIRIALGRDPSLTAAAIEARRAALAVRSEEYRFVAALSAELDYAHSEQPTLTSTGVVVGRGDALTARLGIDHQFPWGTLVAAALTLEGSATRAPAFGLGAPVELGPAYGAHVRLSLTQPLLRGLGRAAWEAPLRGARVEARAARTAREEVASVVARDVLTAYWELWFAARAVAIGEEALSVSERRLADAEARLAAGALAPFDVLPLRSDRAARAEALMTARAGVDTRRVALARALGLPPMEAPTLAGDPPTASDAIPDPSEAAARARARSYQLASLEAAVDLTRVQLEVASDAARVRLDAGTWLQVSGLGDGRVDDTFAQLGTFGAVSGGVSLALALPVVSDARVADEERARLAVTGARAHLTDAQERLGAAAVELVVAWRAARERATYAQETSRLAAANADGQAARFASGAGTVLELIVADQQRREAELRVVRAAVDEELARLALAHLTGDLLPSVAPP